MRNLILAAAVGIALLAAPSAMATTINAFAWFGAPNGPTPADNPKTYVATDFTGVSQKIVLPKFDTSLGTLTSATLTLYADANSSGRLTNSGASRATVSSYVASLNLRLLAPSNSSTGPGIDTPASVTTPFLLTVSPALLTVTNTRINAGSFINFSVLGTSATSGALDILTSGYSGFFSALGGGFVTLPVFNRATTTTTVSGGNLDLVQSTAARAEALVTYVYPATPPPPPVTIPEPLSIALMGAALFGLSIARRRD